uniref:NACHT domain-containing protein n=1 Tax=Thermosporothrix sp. COM3 TaxID=2490863 RepID=A0A455SHN9_9CHLR|nr:hypothetical protein KTC_11630 [Thermosporothrix sp. COM3]
MSPFQPYDMFCLPAWQYELNYTYWQAKSRYDQQCTARLFWQDIRIQQPRLVIVGRHGSGKSWLLRQECLAVCSQVQRCLQDEQDEQEMVLPIWLSGPECVRVLSAYRGNVVVALQQILRETLGDERGHDALLEEWLRAHPTLFLLDDYDLLDPEQRALVGTFLSWVETLPHARLVCAVRPEAAAALDLSSAFFVELLDWTDTQCKRYLLQRFAADPMMAAACWEQLQAPEYGEARVPLVLAWWSAFYAEQQRLPATCFEGYMWVLQHLLQRAMQSADLSLLREIVCPALERLAWTWATAVHGGWQGMLSRAEILMVLRQAGAGARAEAYLALLEQSGVLCRSVGHRGAPWNQQRVHYSWGSPVFPCVLVARMLTQQQWMWSDLLLLEKRCSPFWQQVVHLLAGANAPAVLRWVEEQRFSLQRDTASILLLARVGRELRRAGEALSPALVGWIADGLLQLELGSRKERRQAYALMKQLFGADVRARMLARLQMDGASLARRCAAVLALGVVGTNMDSEVLEQIVLDDGHVPELRGVALLVCWQVDEERAEKLCHSIFRRKEASLLVCGVALWTSVEKRASDMREEIVALLQRRGEVNSDKEQEWLLFDEVLIWAVVRLWKHSLPYPEEVWRLVAQHPSMLPIMLEELGWEEPIARRILRKWLRMTSADQEKSRAFVKRMADSHNPHKERLFPLLQEECQDGEILQWVTRWLEEKQKDEQRRIEIAEDEQEEAASFAQVLRVRGEIGEEEGHILLNQPEKVIPLIVARDEELWTREQALRWLWSYGDEQSWLPLLHVASDPTDDGELRKTALHVLHRKKPQPGEVLYPFLWDRDERVQAEAAYILSEIQDTTCIERIGFLLCHMEDEETQGRVERACVRYRDAAVHESLRTMIMQNMQYLRMRESDVKEHIVEYAVGRVLDEISIGAIASFDSATRWHILSLMLQRCYGEVGDLFWRKGFLEAASDQRIGIPYLIAGFFGVEEAALETIRAWWRSDGQDSYTMRSDANFGVIALGGALLRNEVSLYV